MVGIVCEGENAGFYHLQRSSFGVVIVLQLSASPMPHAACSMPIITETRAVMYRYTISCARGHILQIYPSYLRQSFALVSVVGSLGGGDPRSLSRTCPDVNVVTPFLLFGGLFAAATAAATTAAIASICGL